MSKGSAPLTIEIAERRCTVRDVTDADSAAVVALHNRVFDAAGADESWFRWKYGAGSGEAVGLWDDTDTLVAYCGGVPRPLFQDGRPVAGIQIGDVMVAPEWRGVLTRRGPFYQVSQRFYQTRIGPERPHQVAFGFPSERHLRLAVALDLLWDGGPIHNLQWPATAPVHTGGWRWRPLAPEAGFDALVTRAWAAMRESLSGVTLGQRDSRYVRWRFVDFPGRQYRFFGLKRHWFGRACGLAVLRLEPKLAQWLDWIGPPELMPHAVLAARAEAARVGALALTAWASPYVAQQLASTGAAVAGAAAWLGLPTTSCLSPAQRASARWWWMGGDTDFL